MSADSRILQRFSQGKRSKRRCEYSEGRELLGSYTLHALHVTPQQHLRIVHMLPWQPSVQPRFSCSAHALSPSQANPAVHSKLMVLLMQVLQLQSQLQDLSSRSADELEEAKTNFSERLAAIQAELEQQEADKAALLDIVQVLFFTSAAH